MEDIEIVHKALIIRIGKSYKDTMHTDEIYDAVRGTWRISKRREQADIALAVHKGKVIGVFTIHSWHKAGETKYKYVRDLTLHQRWEFLGEEASQDISGLYMNKSIKKYCNGQNPIIYTF